MREGGVDGVGAALRIQHVTRASSMSLADINISIGRM